MFQSEPQRSIQQSIAGAMLIVGCIAAGSVAAFVIDLVAPGTLLRGRDFHRAAVLVSLLLVIVGVWWRGNLGPHGWTMLVALGLVEGLIASLIVLISGSRFGDRFFFDWFLGVSVYLVVPWVSAFVLGWLLGRGRPPKTAVDPKRG